MGRDATYSGRCPMTSGIVAILFIATVLVSTIVVASWTIKAKPLSLVISVAEYLSLYQHIVHHNTLMLLQLGCAHVFPENRQGLI